MMFQFDVGSSGGERRRESVTVRVVVFVAILRLSFTGLYALLLHSCRSVNTM